MAIDGHVERSALYRELGLGLINGLVFYACLTALIWIRYWTTAIVERVPSLSSVVMALALGAAIVLAHNISRSPNRIVFAMVRTVAHALFGVASPAAGLLLGILSAPHGMSALPRIGPALCIVFLAALAGFVLVRWIVVPRRED